MKYQTVTAWTAAAAIALGGAVVACDDGTYITCPAGQVCDDGGQPLIYAPYIVPAYGIFGQPGYHQSVTYYPGSPQYHTTYVNHPPNYNPPVKPPPPSSNPRNTVATSVKVSAPPGYTAPKVTVKAPSVGVNAPSVGVGKPSSAPKPASKPATSGGKSK